MKMLIAGSRTLSPSIEEIDAQVPRPEKVTAVISGTAAGVDRAGEKWAAHHGIPVERMPADWDRLGKKAGYVRNEAMALACGCALVFWDGASSGTRHMINLAKAHGKPVKVVAPEISTR